MLLPRTLVVVNNNHTYVQVVISFLISVRPRTRLSRELPNFRPGNPCRFGLLPGHRVLRIHGMETRQIDKIRNVFKVFQKKKPLLLKKNVYIFFSHFFFLILAF